MPNHSPSSFRRWFSLSVAIAFTLLGGESHAAPKPKQLPHSPTPTTPPGPATLPQAPTLPPNTGPLPGGKVPTPILDNIDNWGFELGLRGWTKTGTAFDHQPTFGDNVVGHRIFNGSTGLSMPLGGDYWRDASYPIGHRGGRWIGTYENHPSNAGTLGTVAGDGATGTLTSKPFEPSTNFITFLIGGGNDRAKLRVELLVRENSAKAALSFPDGKYRVVPGTVTTGHDNELMRRAWWNVSKLRGKTLRIRIVDDKTSGWGHINVDDFQFQDRAPPQTRVKLGSGRVAQVRSHLFRPGDASTLGFVDWDAPVWGVADLHTHPASHLGFGKKLMYGDPDGPMDDAMGNCNCTHGGWGLDNTCGNYVRMAVVSMTDGIFKFKADLDHPHAGAPRLRHWPHFTSVTHQQMRHEWIRRAHEGGLRVMVALAVNNHLLAEALDGESPRDDKNSANAQIEFMKDFVHRHRDFMEIALGPDHLRDIVRRGKLAVVLGIEVDNIGNFNFSTVRASDTAIVDEIRRLHAAGIRYIFPVHVTDNKFGGAAVYEDMFNYANRFASVQPLPPNLGAMVPGQSFRLEHAPDPLVTKRLSPPLANVWAVGIRTAVEAIEAMPSPTPPVPIAAYLSGQRDYQVVKHYFLTPDPATEVWGTIPGGHRNRRGLTAKGRVAIREMMRLGMIIDIDHMSERTANAVLDIAESGDAKYPLVSGHNTFRAMAASEHGNENQRSEEQGRRLMDLGGMMGVGWGYQKDEHHTPSFSEAIRTRGGQAWTTSSVGNDCGGSSKRFANQYLYALEKMGHDFVGLGTDINGLVPTPGPRFGPDAKYDGNRCNAQSRPVTYVGAVGNENAPLRPLAKPRGGTWTINRDGVANYGLLPDFLQDLRNVGVDPHDMSPLLNSAESFAKVWETAARASESR